MFGKIPSSRELNDRLLLKKIEKLARESSIIKDTSPSPRYYDEPVIYQFSARIASIRNEDRSSTGTLYGGGSSFNKKKAIIKAFCEAIERYCLKKYKKSELIRASFKDFSESEALPLGDIVSISDTQRRNKRFIRFRWDRNDKFCWVKGKFLSDGRNVFIPAQLVFVPYNLKEEKILRLPISTGAALGTTITGALLRGIFEIIERDAFMIHYLSRIHGGLVDISSDHRLDKIAKYFRKYRLKLFLINLPTDFKIYTFLSILIDKTGVGPAVSAGLKSGLNPYNVALGSIEESWHSRPWIRSALEKGPDLDEIASRANSLFDLRERGLFWARPGMIKYIKPWIDRSKKIKFSELPDLSKGSDSGDLQYILEQLWQHNYDTYWVDITRPDVKKYGFIVIKAVIPSLQPLYLDESYPYYGGRRLYEVPLKLGFLAKPKKESELEKVPHFFL